MGLVMNLFLASVLGGVLLTRRFPEYAPFGSTGVTTLVMFLMLLMPYGVYAVLIYPFYLSPLRHLPEPSGGSVFNGHLSTVLEEPSGEPQRRWMTEVPNEGLIRYRHFLNAERVLVVSPKALAEVLTTKVYDFCKPRAVRNGLGRVLGIGILLAEGDEHKYQRKNLMPAFAYRHIKDLYPLFWTKGREITDKIAKDLKAQALETNAVDEKTGTAGVLEVSEYASRVTLDIIGVAGMGHDFNSIEDPNSELNVCYRRIFKPSRGAQLLQLAGLILPAWLLRRLPFSRNTELEEARLLIRRVCQDLINSKKSALKDRQAADRDILAVAISSGAFTDEDLINQLMTFLAAGHETTASAVQWALHLLCKYPEYQYRLRAEVRANLPRLSDTSAVLSPTALDSCAFLNAFCNEVLRFIPTVPLTLRLAVRDTAILGVHIPKDTTVIICPWATNTAPSLWTSSSAPVSLPPDTFDPERWLAPGKANSGGAESNYAFLTFLHGPRGCIGRDFAKAEFAALVAAWVGRFEVAHEAEDYVVQIQGGVTARPKGGLRIRMREVPEW